MEQALKTIARWLNEGATIKAQTPGSVVFYHDGTIGGLLVQGARTGLEVIISPKPEYKIERVKYGSGIEVYFAYVKREGDTRWESLTNPLQKNADLSKDAAMKLIEHDKMQRQVEQQTVYRE